MSLQELILDPDTYTVNMGSRRLRLTLREFRLLRYLLEHRGRILPRSQILSDVWGTGYRGTPRTLDVHILRLRHKLGEAGGSSVRTVRGVGYGIVEGP